ncbi:MAG: hypothetical protein L0Y76_03540 [Ignavibacteria bacterium]|nr:hypothetical protein [Ignavibacteria bacterium]
MEFNLFTERSSAFTACSKCGTSGRMSRMKPDSGTQKILFKILKIRKYHCKDCKHNEIFFNYRLKKNAARILLNNILLLAAAAAAVIILNYII